MITPTQSLVLWLYAAVISIWPIRHLALCFILRSFDILRPSSARYQGEVQPLVSAIIPAKDEEATLGDCLASVCAQEYANLEILVVDDRSTDRTAAIAQEFASRDPRVRVISIVDLPSGWTGKTHALQVAANQAEGAWFWFLDADTRHTPENLSVVMEYARSNGAALVSVLPEMRCETFWENVVQPLAGIVLMQSFPLHQVNDVRSKKAFANGQYILIEREAYNAAGGHHAVRDRFVEDIGMARRVKDLGLPIRVAVTQGLGSTRMYSSLNKLVRGWSRILYDALDRNPVRLVLRLLDPLVFSQTGHVALAASLYLLLAGGATPFALWLLGLSLMHHGLTHTVLHRLYVLSVPRTRYTAWFPLANLVMDWILIRAIRSCLTGEVTWRGTDYGRAHVAARRSMTQAPQVEM